MVRFSIMEEEIREGTCSRCMNSKHSFKWMTPVEVPLHVVKVLRLPNGEEEWRCYECIRSLDPDLARKLSNMDHRSASTAYQDLRERYLANSTWELLISGALPSGEGLAALNIHYLGGSDNYIVVVPSAPKGERMWVRISDLVPSYGNIVRGERIAKHVGNYKCGNCGNEAQERFHRSGSVVSCRSCAKRLNRNEKLSKKQITSVLSQRELLGSEQNRTAQ